MPFKFWFLFGFFIIPFWENIKNNNKDEIEAFLPEINKFFDEPGNETLIKELVVENKIWLNETLPKSVFLFLEWTIKNGNATAEEITNALKTTIENEMYEFTDGLFQDEILDLINKKLQQINNRKADVIGEFLTDISKIKANSTSNLIQILQATSNALKKSMSFTINGKPLLDRSILYAKINNSESGLILVNGYISATKSNTVYLEGDFRVAEFLPEFGLLDYLDVIYTYKNASAFSYIKENYTIIYAESGPFQTFSLSSIFGVTFFGDTNIYINSDDAFNQHLITAWNVSIDETTLKYGMNQTIGTNATFTTFVPLSKKQSYVTFPILTNSSIKKFMVGKPLNITDTKLSFNISTKDYEKVFVTMVIKSGEIHFKKSNEVISLWISDFELLNANYLFSNTGYNWEEFIPNTLKLENVNKSFIQNLIPGKNIQISINGDKQLPVNLITVFGYEKELEINIDFRRLSYSSLIINGTWKNINEFQSVFLQGITVNVASGRLVFDDGKTVDFSNNGSIKYSGTTLLYQTSQNSTIHELNDVLWDVSMNEGKIIINIEKAMVNINSAKHFDTIIILKNGVEIKISGGVLYRNSSNGYIISTCEISANGIDLNEDVLKKQSLLNFKAQKALAEIMENVTDFLKENGTKMSNKATENAAKHLLSISDDISLALEAGILNPLDSILTESLTFYDDMFNWLPQNPADIRYIEDICYEDECAKEITHIRQKPYTKQLISSMNAMISAIENNAVEKFLDTGKISGSFNYSSGGTTLQINIGKMDDLLNQTYSCNEWSIELPNTISDLNNDNLTENEIYRLSLFCQQTNIYLSTENANSLVTSGYLNSRLKTIDGKIIPIENTKSPIIITVSNKDEKSVATKINSKEFEYYEILDIHTFVTEQLNGTIEIELKFIGNYSTNISLSDVVFFVNSQTLPGPLPKDHELKFTLNPNGPTHVFFDKKSLKNKSGRYFIGMGYQKCEESDSLYSVSYENVMKPPETCYTAKFPFKYSLKITTKAAYFYNERLDKFVDTGIITQKTIGDNFTTFHTNQMTVFSVGMFSPKIQSNSAIKTNVIYDERNPTISFMFFFMFIILNYYLFLSIATEGDDSFGFILNNDDNLPNYNYQYLILVQTSFHRFSSTSDDVYISLFGTEGETLNRKLKGTFCDEFRITNGFRQGVCERYLVCTQKPLGDLHFIELRVDVTEDVDVKQSWNCEQIEIKDMQTEKVFLFEVKKWFDTPKPETIEVRKNRNIFSEACRMSNLVENFIQIFLANSGYGRFRFSIDRFHTPFEYLNYMAIAAGFAFWITKRNAKNFEVGNEQEYLFQIYCYEISWFDILYGCVTGLILSFSMVPSFLIQRNVPNYDMLEDYVCLNKWQKRTYPYGYFILWCLFVMVYIYIYSKLTYGMGLKLRVKLGNKGYEKQINMASKLIYIGFIFHILFEPVKSFLLNVLFLTYRRDYYIIGKDDRYYMNTLPLKAFDHLRNPNPKIPKLTKTDNGKNKKRERIQCDTERFVKSIFLIFAFMFQFSICLGMMYYSSQDSSAFKYRKGLELLFNCDPNSQNIESPMSFFEIKTKNDFWIWAETDLTDAILASNSDGRPTYNFRAYFNDKNSRSMGIGRIRQIRTSNLYKDCGFNSSCIDYNAPEDKTFAYSNGWETVANSTEAEHAYIYRTEKELDGLPYSGKLKTYSGGGYTALLNGSKSNIRKQLKKLQNENWIDERTKAVIVELTAYNAAYNYFAAIKFIVETSHFGMLEPSASIEIIRLFKYLNYEKWVVKSFEIMFTILGIVLILKEIYRLSQHKFRYLKSIWGWNNLFIAFFVILSNIAFYIRLSKINAMIEILEKTNGNVYINFDKIIKLEWFFIFSLALTMIFTTFKILEMLRFNSYVDAMMMSMERTLKWILPSFFCFIFFFAAFTLPLYLLGAENSKGFESIGSIFEMGFVSMLRKSTWLDQGVVGTAVVLIYYIFVMVGIFGAVGIFTMIVTKEYLKILNNPPKPQTVQFGIIGYLKVMVCKIAESL